MTRMEPYRGFSTKTEMAMPNASMVVVDGNEDVAVCQKPRTRAGRTSKGLGLITKHLIRDPMPYEKKPESREISPLVLQSISRCGRKTMAKGIMKSREKRGSKI